MKKRFLAILCMILSVVFVFAAACTDKGGSGKEEEGDYSIEKEEGCNLLTIYYKCDSGYDDRDVWLWYGDVSGTGYKLHACEYGAVAMFNIPDSVEEVGFIIRKNCVPGSSSWGSAQKDGTEADRKIKMKGKGDVTIYTKAGDGNSYSSTDGGVTLEEMKYLALADMTDLTHIKITASNKENITKDRIKITTPGADGKPVEVEISKVFNNNITVTSALDLSKAYTLEVNGFDDPVGVVPATYFQSAEFEQAYTYDGKLGVELEENSTTFRVWAPTASEVDVNIYRDGSLGNAKYYPMVRGEKGVWTYTADENLEGKYYTYTVTTSKGSNEAVDPYARSAGMNGKRGMILDLDKTDPEGWTENTYVDNGVENYTDAQIWEVHIRDFSNKITDSKLPEKYRGKYLGFTVEGLKNASGVPVGIDYLKELGINYVHLLPSYDYSSVDENAPDESFNWGYDPENYNVPEGSYSTDPDDGAVRVNEYKQMVQALHKAGIGVIMDVVYNHTYSIDSNLNKIVPYYYYRYGSDGNPSNGSGCGNETASERSMVRRYMVDSVTYWQNEYNLDGFRFDLMGVHDITTMQEIEKAVHATNPKALIYGEGWTGGGVELAAGEQATLANLQKMNEGTSTGGVNGIALFNDVIRDGIKGSTFNMSDTGYATGARADCLDKVLFGVTGSTPVSGPNKFTEYSGSWTAANPTQVINYVSAHDNNTLWDRICTVYGEGSDTLDKRLAMNRLSAAIVQTSLGIPFMQAGEEMLRTKKNEDGTYNENSYNAPDSVNNIDWDALTTDSDQYKTMQYYKGLIAFRKANPTLRQATAGDYKTGSLCRIVKKDGAAVAFTITNASNTSEKLLIIYNPTANAKQFTLPAGSWNLYINGTNAGTTVLGTAAGGSSVSVAGISCHVYKLA